MKSVIITLALIIVATAKLLAATTTRENSSINAPSIRMLADSPDKYITDDQIEGLETVVLHVGEQIDIPADFSTQISSSNDQVISNWGIMITDKGVVTVCESHSVGEAKLTITYSDGTIQQVDVSVVE